MERIETASAIVERVNPDLVVCRYRKGAKVDVRAVAENVQARMRFPGKEPYAVIGIFPESVDFEMSLIENNHYTDTALNKVTRVLAIVAEGALFEPIARLYFAYYPPQFSTGVFTTEEEARKWVQSRIQCIRNVDVLMA